MLNDLLELVRLQGVEYGEEVGAVDLAALRHAVWQVLHQLLVVTEHVQHVCNIELLVEGYMHGHDVTYLQELLLLLEDAAEEVLGDVVDGREVVLH